MLASLALVTATSASPVAAQAVKSTECTKIGICYCVNSDLKPVIEARIAQFRQLAVEQRKAGKAVGYLSVPLSPAMIWVSTANCGRLDRPHEIAAGLIHGSGSVHRPTCP